MTTPAPLSPTSTDPLPDDLAGFAARHGLAPVGRRQPLGRYLRELWSHRQFVWELSRSRFVARNQQDRLGLFWNVLRPAIQATVYGVVFGLLFASSTRPHNWIAFITSGVFVWTFSSSISGSGSRAVTGNMGLVRALHFPRAALPISATLVELLAQIPVVVVLLGIVLITGESPSVFWLLVVPALIAQTLFNTGFSLFAARLTVHIPDFAQLLPFIMRLLFYLSGVFYTVNRFPEWVRPILLGNPFWCYIEMFRESTIGRETSKAVNGHTVYGHLPPEHAFDPKVWIVGCTVGVVACVAGLLFFWHAEERYGRE